MKFEFLIFDLDGTIIDSEADVSFALNRVLADYHLEAIPRDVIRTHVGYGIQPLLKEALARGGVNDPAEALSTFTKYYFEHCVRETTVFEGVRDTLVRLGAYRKVVLTNKSTKFIDPILKGLDLERDFVGAYGRESFAKMKPDPLPILSILELHGARLDRTLMIGDTETDIHAGQNAGVATCLVTYGYGRGEALSTLTPSYTIPKIGSLIEIVS